MTNLLLSNENMQQYRCFFFISGKLNSSLNRSLSSTTAPAPTSINRLANHSKPRRSTVYATADPTSSTTGGRRSLSTQARKLSEVEPFKAVRSTSLKRAEATPLQLTPAKRMLQRTVSVPPTAFVRPQSGLKAKPKPEAQVPPTPSGGVRGDHHGDGERCCEWPSCFRNSENCDFCSETEI